MDLTVDPNLGNINVNQGFLGIQGSTTTLGLSSDTLTVAAGATLDFYAALGTYAKNFILNGDGVTTTLEIENTTATMSGPVTFNGNCLVSLAGTSLTLASGASGGAAGSMSISGTGELQLQGTLTYTGNILQTQGTLEFDSVDAAGSGSLSNAVGATLQSGGGAGGGFSGAVQVNGILTPGGTNQIGAFVSGPLTLNSATLNLDEGSSTSLDTIAVTGNLVLTGVNILQLNPSGSSLAAGQTLINITYTGALIGASNNLQLVSTTPGYLYQLVDPATTPGSIVINLLHVPQQQIWHGGAASRPTTWDVGVTPNWEDNSSNNILNVFSTGDFTTFDDSATTFNINVAAPVEPLSMTFQNNSHVYTLSGSGYLTNVPVLTEVGGQIVVLDNGGSNNSISGGLFINGAGLQLGNDDTNGTVGAANITNNSYLYFDHSDTLGIPGAISGLGSLVQIGSGVTVLSGTNTNFYGSVVVSNGTLRLGSATALGTANNISIIVSNGATLDITNTENIGIGYVTIGGSGVGGAGALIDSSGVNAYTVPNLANIIMTSDLTVGGSGRLDLRDATGTGTAANLTTGGVPMNLIKVGPNTVGSAPDLVSQFQMTGVQVDGALSNITVQGGELGIQANISGLGNPTNFLTLWTNTELNIYQLSNEMFKVMILSNDATIHDQSGPATWGGPITLAQSPGSNIFNLASTFFVDNIIGGSGTLVQIGGTLLLSQSNTYTGQTLINSGTLQFTNDDAGASDTNGSIASSSLINVAAGANIDVSQITPATLNIVSGQTLTGGGAILGSLSVNSGGTLSPLAPGSTITVTNNAFLAGTTIMPISKTPLLASTLATSTGGGNISFGGALQVTNTAGTMKGGESFQLFKNGGAGIINSFSSVLLPPLGPGLSWNTTTLDLNGVINVTGALLPPSINTGGVLRSGSNLSVSGSGGTPGATYYVLGTTNLSLPLTEWTPVATNNFDASGNFNFSLSTTSTPGEYFVVEE